MEKVTYIFCSQLSIEECIKCRSKSKCLIYLNNKAKTKELINKAERFIEEQFENKDRRDLNYILLSNEENNSGCNKESCKI